jgi:Tetratricopeptide repeat
VLGVRSRPFAPLTLTVFRLPPVTFGPARAAPSTSALLVVALISLLPVAGFARPDEVTAAEMKTLPAYCIDTEGFGYGHERSANRSPRAGHWEGLMGRGFWTLHHYCYGLIYRHRVASKSVPRGRRAFTIGQMISEYYFVIHNTRPGFVLLPEVWTRIGEAELMRDNVGGAHDAFQTARQLRPDYWPAYSMWAEVLLKARSPDKARTVLAEGLSHAPNSAELLELFRKAGGDPAKLPPPRPAAAEPAASASAAAAAPLAAADAAASAAVAMPAAPPASTP